MKRVMIFFAFVALALVPFSGCAVTMEKRMPFYASALENYNIEEQVLIPGITEESFQISVPRNGEIDQFELRDGVFDRYSVTLPDFKILTSHYNRPVGDRLFLSERSALFILTSDGSKILWEKHFSLYEPTGGFFQGQNGALYATGEGGGKQSKFEVYRISEETGVERTFQLPFSFGAFPIWKLPTKDGIVTYWAGPIGKVKEMAQFFTWEGEEKPHPLVKAFNVLAASQVHIPVPQVGYFPVEQY